MTARPSIFGIAWAGFMTLVIGPVIVFDVLTIVHWRADKVVAFVTLPLLAAALWAFWAGAFRRPPRTPETPTTEDAHGRRATAARRRR